MAEPWYSIKMIPYEPPEVTTDNKGVHYWTSETWIFKPSWVSFEAAWGDSDQDSDSGSIKKDQLINPGPYIWVGNKASMASIMSLSATHATVKFNLTVSLMAPLKFWNPTIFGWRNDACPM